ncbi:hypothetical protein EYF80_040788 [Liparis tanakae]|uniref:Uncharacterized protein n=1 Tax=Liparis tanakae TaxID=230148 RepID=A0A4Z2G635_9TELE|nr:hypothetical protein EYF80_040788 [Liparis tanakae]
MSRSQESMLSVNRSSVLLPWLDPNTLWLAWNSCLQGGEDTVETNRGHGRNQQRTRGKPTEETNRGHGRHQQRTRWKPTEDMGETNRGHGAHLEGREEPRSEKPLVRESSSGQGLLGVKSTSSPSP